MLEALRPVVEIVSYGECEGNTKEIKSISVVEFQKKTSSRKVF